MPTDPFSPLDRVDPPDQWDDIVERAQHTTDVRRLDAPPERRAVRRPRTWVAAAAAVALVAGGIALASGDDPDDGVATGPTASSAPSEPVTRTFDEGPCPFTVTPGPDVPDLAPGRHPVDPGLGILAGPPTAAHGPLDDLLVEVAVGTGLSLAAEEAGFSASVEGDRGWVEMGRTADSGRVAPCDQVVVVVRLPLRPADVAALPEGQVPPEPYRVRATPVLEAVHAAVTVEAGPRDPSAGHPAPAPAALGGTLANGAPFTVTDDPGRGLCATLGGVDLGCDDVGPVIGPDDDAATPRLGIDQCCPPLWFGYLPDGASTAVLDDADGTRLGVEATVEGAVWALPVPIDQVVDSFTGTDTVVVYVMGDGSEVPAPTPG